MRLTIGSLCSGYEATGLGLRLAGWDHRLAFVADNDPAAAKALAYHHPDAPNLGDITAVDWAAVERVHLLHMGFPCTDLSAAGRRAGLGGTRSGVWANCAEAIAGLRPSLVLIENVRGLLSTPANRSTDAADGDVEPGPAGLGNRADGSVLRAAGAVLGDLADLGYDAIWTTVSAASVGAPHRRERVFILGWPAADPPRFGHGDGGPAGVGRVPAAAVTGGAGADDLTLLPTPEGSDSTGGRVSAELGGTRPSGAKRAVTLATAVAHALLPTPNAALGRQAGNPSARVAAARRANPERTFGLDDAVALLPTPSAGNFNDGEDLEQWQARRAGAAARHGNNGFGVPLGVAVRLADRWGDYAPAIARWEAVTGRPAPAPTEPGSKGQPRLAVAFVEWMQGLPAGYVTGVPGISRNDALRLLGNSNPPQQYAAAFGQLTAIAAGLLTAEAAA